MSERDWSTHPPQTMDELEQAFLDQGVSPKHAREARIGTEAAVKLHTAVKEQRRDDGHRDDEA